MRATMARLALALAMLALVAGGCSGDKRGFVEPMTVTSEGQMVFHQARPSRSHAPGLGAEHLFFFDQRHGFAATTGGGGWVPKVGYELPTEPGRIQQTRDGGKTWRTVWKGRGVVFQSITFAGRNTGLAAAALIDRKHSRLGYTARPTELLLLRTRDAGKSWRRIAPRPTFGPRYWDDFDGVTFSTGQGFQLASSTTWFAFGRELRRSRDAGRTWVKVPTPRGTTLVEFASADVGYAAAAGSDCRGQALWKTSDGARSWSELPGTCGPTFMSLDFLDERRGFTSAGISDYSAVPPVLVIRATTDGGATWQTRYVDDRPYTSRDGHWPSGTELHFVDEREGWAVSHEVSQGFAFDDLHITHDGGRHWARRWYPLSRPSAFVQGGRAWTGTERTTDGGRTWKLSVRPRQIAPYRFLVATRSRLIVDANSQPIESRDAGRSWRTVPPRTARQEAIADARPMYIGSARGSEAEPSAIRTVDRKRLVPPPSLGWVGAVAFSDRDHGLISFGSGEAVEAEPPVFTTRDGGRTWTEVRLPAGTRRDGYIALGPGVIVIEEGLPTRHGNAVVAVSADSGGHWSTLEIGPREAYDPWECGAQRPSTDTIWVLCRPQSASRETIQLRSTNGGRSWSKLSGPVLLDSQFRAISRDEAWAIGRTLWHTVDGGREWTQAWPSLPPSSRSYRLWHYRSDVPNGFG
jgi:photosystem II stability/assembly factor-like uncharacterized protein